MWKREDRQTARKAGMEVGILMESAYYTTWKLSSVHCVQHTQEGQLVCVEGLWRGDVSGFSHPEEGRGSCQVVDTLSTSAHGAAEGIAISLSLTWGRLSYSLVSEVWLCPCKQQGFIQDLLHPLPEVEFIEKLPYHLWTKSDPQVLISYCDSLPKQYVVKCKKKKCKQKIIGEYLMLFLQNNMKQKKNHEEML